MVSTLALSVVDSGLDPPEYQIGICCFSSKHAAIRSKSRDWLALYHDNVFEWSDMSTHGLVVSVS
jgi:hypothetical protein